MFGVTFFAQFWLVEALRCTLCAAGFVSPATLTVATEVALTAATAVATAIAVTSATVSAARATVVTEVKNFGSRGWCNRAGKLFEQFARRAHFAEDAVTVCASKKIF
jgi:hypothetical protein